MPQIGRAHSLKSARDSVGLRPDNVNALPDDENDALPPSTRTSFSNFFRRSKEVKPSEEGSRPSSTVDLSSSTRPAPRDSLLINDPDSQRRYFMGHESRGIALIINNKVFQSSLKLGERAGTDVDAAALKEGFLDLGFTSGNIHRYDDVTCKDMAKLLDYFATKTDYEGMDCFFCVILSHGSEAGVIYGYDGKTTLDFLLDPFKRSPHHTLIGKPKIIFVQACRGGKFEEGVVMRGRVEEDGGTSPRIPLESDFIYAYSTVPGYFSWRNAVRGTWFIEAFTKNIKKYRRDRNMDLLRLLTRVNYDVAYDYQSNVPADERMHLKKQMPSIVSMLTKELYFF